MIPPASERQLVDAPSSNKVTVKYTKSSDDGKDMGQCHDQNDVPMALTRGHAVISCEECGIIIRLKEYKEHLKSHSQILVAVPLAGTAYN